MWMGEYGWNVEFCQKSIVQDLVLYTSETHHHMPLTVLSAALLALTTLNADTRRVNNAHLSLLVIIFGKCLLELAQLNQLVVLLLPFTRVNARKARLH